MPDRTDPRGARRRLTLAAACTAGVIFAFAILPAARARTPSVPERLTDLEFWDLMTQASEPGGTFRSANITNLTSNEMLYQHVLPELVSRVHGGVYLGVGPEQNYTYMAAIKPALAVIFDIRRGNLDLQLMYKAVFELSADRAAFVSMLFSRPRPEGLSADTSVERLFDAFQRVQPSETLYRQNLKAIENQLTKTHQLPLGADDMAGLEEVYQTFFWSGFEVRPSPTYQDLMTATDQNGVARSYLATPALYAVMKDLESKNLVVPVVGDFGGPKAIRAVAGYLRSHGAVVSAFYLSNVEQYLEQDGKWDTFCRNVASLPIDASSTFIRSSSGGGGGGFARGPGFISSLGSIAEDTRSCR